MIALTQGLSSSTMAFEDLLSLTLLNEMQEPGVETDTDAQLGGGGSSGVTPTVEEIEVGPLIAAIPDDPSACQQT